MLALLDLNFHFSCSILAHILILLDIGAVSILKISSVAVEIFPFRALSLDILLRFIVAIFFHLEAFVVGSLEV